MSQSSNAKKLPAREPVVVQTTHTNVPGTVKWFNAKKGYGFVVCKDVGRDIFLPLEVLALTGLKEISDKHPVHVSYGTGPKGLVATSLRI